VGTPLVAGGVVYVGAEDGPGGPGVVMALDAATGATRWTAPTGSGLGSGSLALADGKVFALPDGGAGSPMVALDAATGRLRWRSYVTRTGGATGTVAVAGGLLYVTGDGVLLAKDAGNGVNRWKAFPTRDGGRAG
jgi:outer membrane protein assembly factor BamB